MYKCARWPLIQSVYADHWFSQCTLTIDSVCVHLALSRVRTNVHTDHWFSQCALSTLPCTYKHARWPLIQSVYTLHLALYVQMCTLTIDSVSVHSALSPVCTNVHTDHWFSQCTLCTQPCTYKRARWPFIQTVYTQPCTYKRARWPLTQSVYNLHLVLYVQRQVYPAKSDTFM